MPKHVLHSATRGKRVLPSTVCAQSVGNTHRKLVTAFLIPLSPFGSRHPLLSVNRDVNRDKGCSSPLRNAAYVFLRFFTFFQLPQRRQPALELNNQTNIPFIDSCRVRVQRVAARRQTACTDLIGQVPDGQFYCPMRLFSI